MRSTRGNIRSAGSASSAASVRLFVGRRRRPVSRSRPEPSARAAVGASSFRAQVAKKQALRKSALRDCSQRCVYCATQLDQRSATLDHVVPLARGGPHDAGNLVSACGPCNRLKGNLLPFEFFARHPWAGANFVRYARNVTRALKRGARRAVSLAYARCDDALAA